jgi:hypothetical protein
VLPESLGPIGSVAGALQNTPMKYGATFEFTLPSEPYFSRKRLACDIA